jgi:hypothetical protein
VTSDTSALSRAQYAGPRVARLNFLIAVQKILTGPGLALGCTGLHWVVPASGALAAAGPGSVRGGGRERQRTGAATALVFSVRWRRWDVPAASVQPWLFVNWLLWRPTQCCARG